MITFREEPVVLHVLRAGKAGGKPRRLSARKRELCVRKPAFLPPETLHRITSLLMTIPFLTNLHLKQRNSETTIQKLQ